MTDRELAEAVEALGILCSNSEALYSLDKPPAHIYCWMPATLAVIDWRVAGALMEEVDITKLDWDSIGIRAVVINSRPRAIIEACVEALTGE